MLTKGRHFCDTGDQQASTPLGSLGKLPREIRDKIYESVVCKDYWFVFWSQACPEVKSLDFGILTASKAVSKEAQETLYKGSRFILNAKPDCTFEPTASDGLANIARVRHWQVWLAIDSWCHSLDLPGSDGGRKESEIQELAGFIPRLLEPQISKVHGGSFMLQIVPDLNKKLPLTSVHMVQKAFLQKANLLGGFKTVNLDLMLHKSGFSMAKYFDAMPPLPTKDELKALQTAALEDEKSSRSLKVKDIVSFTPGRYVYKDMQAALEPTLGPGRLRNIAGFEKSSTFVLTVEYKPLSFNRTKSTKA